MAANFDELIANGYKVMNADLEPETKKLGTKITLRVCDASDMMRDVWKVRGNFCRYVGRTSLPVFDWTFEAVHGKIFTFEMGKRIRLVRGHGRGSFHLGN